MLTLTPSFYDVFTMNRYKAIDLLRTIAIIAMVPCHFSEFFSSDQGPWGWINFLTDDLIGDFAAPLFLFLVGISLVISDDHATAKGTLKSQTNKLIARGSFIFLAGLFFRALNYGPNDILAFGVLSLIGCITFLYIILRKIPSMGILLLVIGVFFASPYLRGLVPDSYAIWKVGFQPVTIEGPWNTVSTHFLHTKLSYHDIHLPNNVSQIFFSLLLSGEFPLFPWMIFPLLGMIIGRKIVARNAPIFFIALTSGALLIAGMIMAHIGTFRPFDCHATSLITAISFFPSTPSLFTIGMGIVLGLYALAERGCQKMSAFHVQYLTPVYSRISRYSLTIYFLHHTLGIWFVKSLSLITHSNQFAHLTTPFGSLCISIIFLILIYRITLGWDKINGQFSLEWILKRVIDYFVKSSQ